MRHRTIKAGSAVILKKELKHGDSLHSIRLVSFKLKVSFTQMEASRLDSSSRKPTIVRSFKHLRTITNNYRRCKLERTTRSRNSKSNCKQQKRSLKGRDIRNKCFSCGCSGECQPRSNVQVSWISQKQSALFYPWSPTLLSLVCYLESLKGILLSWRSSSSRRNRPRHKKPWMTPH